MNHSIAFQTVPVPEMIDFPVQCLGIHPEIPDTKCLEHKAERFQIINQVCRPQSQYSRSNGRIGKIPGIGCPYGGSGTQIRIPCLGIFYDEYLLQCRYIGSYGTLTKVVRLICNKMRPDSTVGSLSSLVPCIRT